MLLQGWRGLGQRLKAPVRVPPALLRRCGCPGCWGLPFRSVGCPAAPAPGHPEGTAGAPPCCAPVRGWPLQGSACCASLSLLWSRFHRPQRLQSCLQKRPRGGDSHGLKRSRVQRLHVKTGPLEPWIPPQVPSQPRLPAVLSPEAWSHMGPPSSGARQRNRARDCAVHDTHRHLGGPALCCWPPEAPSCPLSP